MEKYVIKDGLVRSLAEDANDILDKSLSNIRASLGVFVRRPGIKLSSINDFKILVELAAAQGKATLSGLNAIIFRDGTYCVPAAEVLVDYFSKASPEYYRLAVLRKSFSVDLEGVKTVIPELVILRYDDTVAPALETSDIPLFLIDISGGVVGNIVADYRLDNSILLVGDCDTAAPDPPTNIEVTSVYQMQLLAQQGAAKKYVNIDSPHTNKSVAQVFTRIVWESVNLDTGILLYQVSMTPLSKSGIEMPNLAIIENVLPDPGTKQHEILIPSAEAVKYAIRIRAIDDSFARNVGEWSDPIYTVVGTDLLDSRPAAPDITISKRDNPTVLSINVSVASPPPEPYFIQVFKVIPSFGSAPLRSDLIYEGGPGTIQLLLTEDDVEVAIRARVVGPGGVCSEMEIDDGPYSGTYYSPSFGAAEPRDKIISIPVEVTISSLGPGRDKFGLARTFRAPHPGGRVYRAEFFSKGSVAHDALIVPDLDKLELLITSSVGSKEVTLDILSDLYQTDTAHMDFSVATNYIASYHETYDPEDAPYWLEYTNIYVYVVANAGSDNVDTVTVAGTLMLYLDQDKIEEA